MASEREFFFSSMWGFSDVAVSPQRALYSAATDHEQIQEVRRLIQTYDPDLQVKYLRAGAVSTLFPFLSLR